VIFDFERGRASPAALDPILRPACAELAAHFRDNPIPVGAVDAANGKEIVGWEVRCVDDVVAPGGSMAGDGASRTLARAARSA
jgi:hypothetical protein